MTKDKLAMIEEKAVKLQVPSDYKVKIGDKLNSYLAGNKCAKCLLPADFRSIQLDDEGVCNYCHDYQSLSDSINTSQRHQEFVRILENARKRTGNSYDCVVCLSGGKDSTYLLDLLANDYALNVIAVTVDTGFLSDIAKQNIQKAISKIQVDHVFLKASRGIIDIYRYGFTHNGKMGIERDVCNLCDGMIRKEAVQFAIDKNIPLIADGLDPFQLIDAGLYRPDLGIENSLSCWPEDTKELELFRQLYELKNLSIKNAPFELYPFIYLPYDEKPILKRLEEKDIIVDPDPNVTNCKFMYLLDFLDLVRKGFPAYAHNISSELRQEKISPQLAKRWMQRAFLEYAEGEYDKQVLDALNALGIDLKSLV